LLVLVIWLAGCFYTCQLGIDSVVSSLPHIDRITYTNVDSLADIRFLQISTAA
jgi:hypothetical protein